MSTRTLYFRDITNLSITIQWSDTEHCTIVSSMWAKTVFCARFQMTTKVQTDICGHWLSSREATREALLCLHVHAQPF